MRFEITKMQTKSVGNLELHANLPISRAMKMRFYPDSQITANIWLTNPTTNPV